MDSITFTSYSSGMSFGLTLAKLRRSRGWSQEELSNRAGISQRHVSFLETGRAQPGDRSLGKLTKALALRGWEHRSLLIALAPATETNCVQGHHLGFVKQMVERVSRWPSYAFQPDGFLLATNKSFDRLLAYACPTEDIWAATSPSSGPNIYDLVFHPEGLIRWMTNPDEVLPETLRRLRIDASQDPSLLPVLQRIEAYDTCNTVYPHDTLPPRILIEGYRIEGFELQIISVLSHFASPGDIELDTLRIESFVPANAESEKLIRQICSPVGP